MTPPSKTDCERSSDCENGWILFGLIHPFWQSVRVEGGGHSRKGPWVPVVGLRRDEGLTLLGAARRGAARTFLVSFV